MRPLLTKPATLSARALLLLGLLPIAGCGDDLAKAFGFTRQTPNEFTVTTRAPLAMPTSDALPVPEPGAPRPQEQAARTEALETIAPDVALHGDAGAPTPGQNALLAEAGQAAAAPLARGGELRGSTGGILGDLMFWKSRPSGVIVDAEAENRRLSQAAANGNGPTAGATPAVAPR
jgi:hypothetical protein